MDPIKLFPIYTSLVNIPNIGKFGLLHNKEFRIMDYSVVTPDIYQAKYNDPKIFKLELVDVDTVKFHSFFIEEEREFANNVADKLVKYLAKPLTQIIKKFIIF
jgi:hypothetical protein